MTIFHERMPPVAIEYSQPTDLNELFTRSQSESVPNNDPEHCPSFATPVVTTGIGNWFPEIDSGLGDRRAHALHR